MQWLKPCVSLSSTCGEIDVLQVRMLVDVCVCGDLKEGPVTFDLEAVGDLRLRSYIQFPVPAVVLRNKSGTRNYDRNYS